MSEEKQECKDCKHLKDMVQAQTNLLRIYLEMEKDFTTIPLPGGRFAEIKIVGSFPVSLEDLNVIIAALNLIKRSKVLPAGGAP